MTYPPQDYYKSREFKQETIKQLVAAVIFIAVSCLALYLFDKF